MQDGGMRRQAGPNGGDCMTLYPVNEPREAAPIQLVPENAPFRLGSRNDKAVDPTLPERAHRFVVLHEIQASRLRARYFRQEERPEANRLIDRSRRQQCAE